MAQCEFTKMDGNTCGAPALTGSKLCFFHDPSQAATRREAQSAGGLASSEGSSRWQWEAVEPMALDSPVSLAKLLIEQLNQLRGLEPSPRKATAIFYGASILLRLYSQFNYWAYRLPLPK